MIDVCDALYIGQDGKVIRDVGDDRPINVRSITKSIAALAVGLIDVDLDQEYWDLPVTLRQVMTHTTGLSNTAWKKLRDAPDLLKVAKGAKRVTPAGEFDYNNQMTNLVGELVQRKSGERLDRFVEKQIFRPLGIEDYHWPVDEVGTVRVMEGLTMRASDLAKIGRLILNRGQDILPPSWVDQLIADPIPAHFKGLDYQYGKLWWTCEGSWIARGHGGQFLVVIPEEQIVAVRQIEVVDDPEPALDFLAAVKHLVYNL